MSKRETKQANFKKALDRLKEALEEAFTQKLITNEQHWLLMLNDRNMTSHVYKEEMAEEIAERITSCYVQEFELLLEELQ